MQSSSQRIQWVDCARAIAIIAVVVCHCSEAAYPFTPQGFQSLSRPDELIAFASFAFGRIGVPFFLFMTGFLMLDRHYDAVGCVKFWRTRFLKLLLCSEVWIVIYNVFLALWRHDPITPSLLLRDMLFLEQARMYHFWYIPVILGVYLTLPVLAMALERLNPKVIAFPLAIVFVYAFVVPLANAIAPLMGIEPFHPKLDMGFSGGVYGIYLIAGWAVKRGIFKAVPKWSLLAASLVSFIGLVAFLLNSIAHGVFYKPWYDNALLFLSAFFLFGWLSRLKTIPAYAFVRSLAYYSFAIFLIHAPILMMIQPYCLAAHLPSVAAMLLMALISLLSSWLISWLISKVPVVGKWLLYLK